MEIPVATYEDIILARQKVKEIMQKMGFSVLAQTRIVTAVSELARNMVVHAGGGVMSVFQTQPPGSRRGITCIFQDQGPGIPDINMAMKAGFSTSNSMGLGLSGSQKLCKEFSIESTVGRGTRVSITEWI